MVVVEDVGGEGGSEPSMTRGPSAERVDGVDERVERCHLSCCRLPHFHCRCRCTSTAIDEEVTGGECVGTMRVASSMRASGGDGETSGGRSQPSSRSPLQCDGSQATQLPRHPLSPPPCRPRAPPPALHPTLRHSPPCAPPSHPPKLRQKALPAPLRATPHPLISSHSLPRVVAPVARMASPLDVTALLLYYRSRMEHDLHAHTVLFDVSTQCSRICTNNGQP